MPNKAELVDEIVDEIWNWKSDDVEGFYLDRTGEYWGDDWESCVSWVEKTMRDDLSKKPKLYVEKMHRELQEVGRL